MKIEQHEIFKGIRENQSNWFGYLTNDLFKAKLPEQEEFFLTLSEDEYNEVVEKGETTILDENQLTNYLSDLNKAIQKNVLSKDDIQKAKKDLTKLVKIKKMVTKNGKTFEQTMYVKPNEVATAKKEKKGEEKPESKGGKGSDDKGLDADKVNGYFLSAVRQGISEEGLMAVEKHYDKLSHINKIRFEREYKAKTGEDYKKSTKYGEDTKESKKKDANDRLNDKVEAKRKEQMAKHKQAMDDGYSEVEAEKIARGKMNNEKSKTGDVLRVDKPETRIAAFREKLAAEAKKKGDKDLEEYAKTATTSQIKQMMAGNPAERRGSDEGTKVEGDKVVIPKKEFIKEHKKLDKVLNSPSRKDDKKEAKDQKKELESVVGKETEKNNQQPRKLSDYKKGDKIWRIMERYNPQLGTYFVFEKKTVQRVSKKSISLDDTRVYDIESGHSKTKSATSYGSANYYIMTDSDTDKFHKELKSNDKRVRGYE
jgi:hypothetical protein